MPEPRALPIPAENREFTVKVGGRPVPREHRLLSASITNVAGKIPSARLCYPDGSASSGSFPLADSDLFVPGASVMIEAGTDARAETLFRGVVVRIAVRIREHSASQLVIDCRHPAMKLTVARRDATYHDRTDGEVIERILGAAGIAHEVEATRPRHGQLVQFHTTDWDFIVARARASGKLVLARGAGLAVKAPALGGSPACTLLYGATLLELDAEVDARLQPEGVRGVTWSPASQSVVESAAAAPGLNGPGNLRPDDLARVAGAGTFELKLAALDEAGARAWAEAAWLRARLNKVSGRAKCEGIGSVEPGAVVRLGGVGARFNGDVYVTGVRHEFDTVQHWKTHVQFGGVDLDRPHADPAPAPAAGGLLAAAPGLQIGVVVGNEDRDGEQRVRVRIPIAGDADGIWARLAAPGAGDDRGFVFRPEPGDEVVVGFLDDDPRHPVILGGLHSSARPAPLPGTDANDEKAYKSRSGLRLSFNDRTKTVRLETPAGNAVTLDEREKSLVLADQNGNSIAMTPEGIALKSAKALSLKAGTTAALESGTAFSARAGTELSLEGTAKAELTSAATTKVVGSLVQIN